MAKKPGKNFLVSTLEKVILKNIYYNDVGIAFFFLARQRVGILVSQPGIESVSPALEAQCLNQWTPREVPSKIILIYFI